MASRTGQHLHHARGFLGLVLLCFFMMISVGLFESDRWTNPWDQHEQSSLPPAKQPPTTRTSTPRRRAGAARPARKQKASKSNMPESALVHVRRTQQSRQITSRQCFDLVVTIQKTTHAAVYVNEKEYNHCVGFLMRDDVVITSKTCADDASAVDVPGYGTRTISSNIKTSSSLSLLSLELPKYDRLKGPEYHINTGWPRRRIFIGNSNETESQYSSFRSDGLRFLLQCDDNDQMRPILSIQVENGTEVSQNFMLPKQNDTFNSLMSDMLHDAHDWQRLYAAMMNGKGERWWVPKETLEQVNATIDEWLAKHSDVPEGAIGLADGFYGLFAVIKMEDPMGGRSPICFDLYFDMWERTKPFSGEPFFQWLDYGSGRKTEMTGCPYRKFVSRQIHYFNETERAAAAVDMSMQGHRIKLQHTATGTALRKGRWLFVQGLDQKLYFVREDRDIVGHVSVFQGKPVLFAGEAYLCSDGSVLELNTLSGHYTPEKKHCTAFFQYLSQHGARYDSLVWRTNHTDGSLPLWKKQFGDAVMVAQDSRSELCKEQKRSLPRLFWS